MTYYTGRINKPLLDVSQKKKGGEGPLRRKGGGVICDSISNWLTEVVTEECTKSVGPSGEL